MPLNREPSKHVAAALLFGALAVTSAIAQPFVEVPSAFPSYSRSAAMWGDYDNDRDLDLLMVGSDSLSNPGAAIFRHRSTGTYTNVAAALAGDAAASGLWSDLDGDNDLDVLVAGELYTRLYRNNGNGSFTEVVGSLPDSGRARAVLEDFDGDGRIDVALCQQPYGLDPLLRLYRNTGALTFSELPDAGLPGYLALTMSAADFDRDGDMDLLLAGNPLFTGINCTIYQNDGTGRFTGYFANLPGVLSGASAWGDYDNDGDPDLLLGGAGLVGAVTYLYRNDAGVFVDSGLVLPQLTGPAAAWGDFDHDGRLDLALAGRDATLGVTAQLWHNQGGGVFTNLNFTFPGFNQGAACWADENNDGRLDLLLTGTLSSGGALTSLLRAQGGGTNTPPTAPGNLVATTNGSSVTLRWTAATDANQDTGLTYNVRVGRTTGASNVRSPMSASTGYRLIATPGNAGSRLSLTLTNLAPGNHFWAVQAVDNGFAGSPFAAERTFIMQSPPTISAISNVTINVNTSTGPLAFTVGDLESSATSLQVAATSSDTNLVATAGLVLSGTGASRSVTVTPAANMTGFVSITLTLTDPAGASTSESFEVEVFNHPPTITTIPDVTIDPDTSTGPIPFEVADLESPAATLQVVATSSNSALVDESGLLLAGVGEQRTITVTPKSGWAGTTTITLAVTDLAGAVATTDFVVEVSNHPPTISAFPAINVLPGFTTLPLPFTIGDVETPAEQLIVSASTSNPQVVSQGSWVLSGTGTQRAIAITTSPYVSGHADIAVTVCDAFGACATSIIDFNSLLIPPLISTVEAQFTPPGIDSRPISVYVADRERPAEALQLLAFSSDQNLLPDWRITVSGSGHYRTVVLHPTSGRTGRTDVVLQVQDGDGGIAATTFSVHVEQFTPYALGIPGTLHGTISWGDFDADGDQDVFISGQVTGGGMAKLYRNHGWLQFEEVSRALPALRANSSQWEDMDADGDLDLLISGALDAAPNTAMTRVFWNTGGSFNTWLELPADPFGGQVRAGDFDHDGDPDLAASGPAIFRNDGAFAFTNLAQGLPNTADSSIEWADWNNDGRLDLTFTGLGRLLLVRWDEHGELLPRDLGAIGSEFGEVQWGDLDADGDLDLAISGENFFGLVGRVYRNDGTGSLVDAQAGATPLAHSALAWGDYDNNGLPDLAQSGNGIGYRSTTKVMRNQSGQLISIPLPDTQMLGQSAMAWADADNDGDLDLLVTGAVAQNGLNPANPRHTVLLRNNEPSRKPPPDPPSSLDATQSGQTFTLSWLPTTNGNQSGGLSYNVRIGTAPGGEDIIPSHSSLSTGYRRVPRMGNASLANRFVTTGLPNGRYYWSVQAVNAAFDGSAFADEASFVVQDPPSLTPPADVTIASNNSTAPLPISIGDTETSAADLTLSARSMNPGLLADEGVLLGGSGAARTIVLTPLPDQLGQATVELVVVDAAGAGTTNRFKLTIVNGVPSVTSQSVTLIEDGELPITIQGSDPDGKPVSYSLVAQPSYGTLTGTAPSLMYRPLPDFFGTDGFSFQVSDGVQDSPPGQVTVNVVGVPDTSAGVLSAQPLGNGQYLLRLQAEPWQQYRVDTSPDLRTWSAWLTLRADPEGRVVQLDAIPRTQRFYRAVPLE